MRNASKTMYKIGRVFSFVLLGIAAIVAVLYLILMIVDLANGNGLHYLGNLIGTILWLGFIIVVIILASNAIKATEEDNQNPGPHVVMIVFGALSGDVFYLLGGIFGLIANAQENSDNQ